MATHFFGAAFFAGEFFFGATPAVTVGGHFVGKKRKREDYAERIAARRKLRAQIIDAMGVPEIRGLLPKPFAWSTAYESPALIEALRKLDEEEDDDLLLLLSPLREDAAPDDDEDDDELLLDG